MRQTLVLSAVLLISPIAGVVGGITGGLFSKAVLAFAGSGHPLLKRLRARSVRFAIGCGLVVAVVGVIAGGASWGTGYGATKFLVEGHGGR